ncbi:MAG: type II toxin-antitoxin system VapC family toxin [Janthinobacterium lividum]
MFLISNDIKLLPINVKHLDCLSTLPFHHKDPFDRLIIAQAITENLTLISADQHFNTYNVDLIQ